MIGLTRTSRPRPHSQDHTVNVKKTIMNITEKLRGAMRRGQTADYAFAFHP
jgi:hypothetical protein